MSKWNSSPEEREKQRRSATLFASVDDFPRRMQEALGKRSNRSLADATGLSEGVLRKYLKGDSYPTLDRLTAIAHHLGVRVSWLASGEGPKLIGETWPQPQAEDGEFAYIDNLSIIAAAGGGRVPEAEVVNNRMAFRKDWLRQHNLHAEDLCFIEADGDSMEPNIRSGDTLLVRVYVHHEGSKIEHGPERSDLPAREGIFVLRLGDGGLVVKRLQPDLEGGYHVRSDNHEYEPLYMKAEDLVIVGRVEWIGRRL